MAEDTRPASRDEFHIGIVCALGLEFDAVSLLFDHFWDKDGDVYGTAHDDYNHYVTGRIGKHNVVLMLLQRMGNNSSAVRTASMCLSYRQLDLVLLVGVCGGVPVVDGREVLLGDVVISNLVVQYDFGRQYPTQIVPKDTVEDSPRKPGRAIQNLVGYLGTELGQGRLRSKTAQYLQELQAAAVRLGRRADYNYPGHARDKLFPAEYVHRHRDACEECESGVCSSAVLTLCTDLGCSDEYLVGRIRLEKQRNTVAETAPVPAIFVGRFGSANVVMKSGAHRDALAKQHHLIAFEMEAAGAWDEVPCIVVKGVCDYADSHKNKHWQHYASATAAAVARAVLDWCNAPDRVAPAAQGSDRRQPALETRNISHNTFGNHTRIHMGNIYGARASSE